MTTMDLRIEEKGQRNQVGKYHRYCQITRMSPKEKENRTRINTSWMHTRSNGNYPIQTHVRIAVSLFIGMMVATKSIVCYVVIGSVGSVGRPGGLPVGSSDAVAGF